MTFVVADSVNLQKVRTKSEVCRPPQAWGGRVF